MGDCDPALPLFICEELDLGCPRCHAVNRQVELPGLARSVFSSHEVVLYFRVEVRTGERVALIACNTDLMGVDEEAVRLGVVAVKDDLALLI